MKKNRTRLYRESFISIRKYLRIMKLTFFLMLFGLMSYASVSYSQATRLTFESKNATIESVFKQIESLSEFKFAYNSTKLDVEKLITLKVENQTINSVLDKVLGFVNFQYRIVDRYVIITDDNSGNSTLLGNSTQQQKTVSGKVTDSSGSPLPGVPIVIKDTSTGVITDMDGKYTLSKIPANAIIQFSFVGMKTQEIPVEGKSLINVTLAEVPIGIDEVVAIGYGTQKKVNLSGSVGTMSTALIKDRPIVNVGQALQGAIGNLNVTVGNGRSDASPSYNIRGYNSISGGDPMIVIDGVVANESSLNNLNPNDIESVSVLKDAASSAIYGSRAAYGVILVTTKMGNDESKNKL